MAASELAVYCRRCGQSLRAHTQTADVPRMSKRVNPAADTVAQKGQLPRAYGALRRLQRARRMSKPRRRPRRLPPVPAEESAVRTLSRRQVIALRWAVAVVLVWTAANAVGSLIALVAIATLLYLASLLYRVRTFSRSLTAPKVEIISDAEARAIWERSLPIYTVLVPAYREAEVIGELIARLDQLEYPHDRLDVKLLLEDDDTETIAAAEAAVTGPHFQIVRIPFSMPRTKPKALNLGLALARGKGAHGMVTIYDAEDRPDPLQLRRAVAAFRRADPKTACFQAKLAYYNADQNIITRWFTIEYAMWFSQLLPGLVQQAAPLPLGGTSNHFRRVVLQEIGGWDAYNVTEDADLGIRLHRAGYRTEVLESVTEEEANSDFVNWVKQRSRWYKGYMQTWLVHMRHPRQLLRELGPSGFIGFNLFVGGTPLLSLLNPVFWTMTIIWFIARPEFVEALFPAWLYYLSLLCLLAGNFAFLYTTMLAARAAGAPKLVLAAALAPAYWVMMSIAAVKALLQLIHAPSFWEKTFHGLDRPKTQEALDRAAA